MKSLYHPNLLRLMSGVVLLTLSACTSGSDNPITPVRTRTSANLQSFESSAALHENLKSIFRDQASSNLDDFLENGMSPARTNGPISSNSTSMGSEKVSGTNNQEAGVDEADIVKTDGSYIHILNGDRLEILKVPEFGELEHRSTLQLEGDPLELLLVDDRAVVFSSVEIASLPPNHPLATKARQITNPASNYSRASSWTKITVVDLSHPSTPLVRSELYLESNYQTARRVQGAVRLVAYSRLGVPGLLYRPNLPQNVWSLSARQQGAIITDAVAAARTENQIALARCQLSDFIPDVYERRPGGELLHHDLTDKDCRDFLTAEDAASTGITSILTLDLDATTPLTDAVHVVSNQSTIYASEDTLLIAERSHEAWWLTTGGGLNATTNLHRFDISEPSVSTYTGSGRVDGTALDSFSLSEYKGQVRVAATTGSGWLQNPLENHVYVLEGANSLNIIGHVGGIGIGEQIWSCRFVENKAFIVTFEQIDPLWTIDLSTPSDPKIMGELEVPGVSTYIHPLTSEGRLLTVGLNTNRQPSSSLFNVQNFSAPTLEARIDLGVPDPYLGWRDVWSEAISDHRAFQYWPPHKLLAIPVDSYRAHPFNGSFESLSTLELIEVDATAGTLTRRGMIDHSAYFNSEPYRPWSSTGIRRTIFMGDYIYAVSDRAVTVHDAAALSLQAVVALPGR